jgi:predicted metal-dependent HD superfamily phosphohydrolase
MIHKKNQILIKADDFVFELFKSGDTSKLLYHNYRHTYDVFSACKEIGEASEISDEDMEVILLAAWFHDVGYLQTCENHEEKGAEIMGEFLAKHNYDSEKVAIIKACIFSTKLGQDPTNILEEIICDADTKVLGCSNYDQSSRLLMAEFAVLKDIVLSEQEWLAQEIDFLSNHRYYTKYAQLNFTGIKSQNLVKKQEELNKFSKKSSEQDQKLKLKEKELKLKTKKADIPEKGIETMFRTALKNHMELSAIADNKANLMLSINALVLSIIISSLFSKFDTHPELMLPTIFILIVCLVTIVLGTLSTKPKITGGKFSQEDVKNRKANLLFFGNFHKMELKDYEWGMKEMMKDKDYLYSSLIRDLHSLGVVLAKKYTYLRLCYLVFMWGMIVSVLTFGAAIAFAQH